MATWFSITFEGEPTEADFARVAELAAQGCTSGQLINEPGAEDEEGPGCSACDRGWKGHVTRPEHFLDEYLRHAQQARRTAATANQEV